METIMDTTELAPSAGDLRDIIRTGVDYIESWYAGDAERMKACLHPELAKRFVSKDTPGGVIVLHTTTAERMYQLTHQGEGATIPERDKKHQVTVLDAFRNIACVKVVSFEYVDYLHVARFDQRWLIVNVIWDFRRLDTD